MNTRVFSFVLAALSAFLTISPVAAGFEAGAAKRVITPDPLLPASGGVGPGREVKEKRGDLFVRAVVVQQGGTRVAFASVDSLGWPGVLCDRVRSRVASVPNENIIIGATHTHGAPDSYGFPDLRGETSADMDYIDWVCTQMAEAIEEAAAGLRPALLRTAVGEAAGKIAYNYYAPQLYDPRCGVIQVLEKDGGQPIATLVNYAIHPEVMLSQPVLTPDLCGPLYDRIEAQGGGMAIFFNSAQGGMVTADNRGPDGRSMEVWDECVRIGTALADEALRIIADAPAQEAPGLYCAAKTVNFPIDSRMILSVMRRSPLSMGVEMSDPPVLPTRLNLVNLGSVQIVTMPGEVLPNIGYYLKRNMPTKQPFLFGLTNEAFGYIMTKVDFNSFKRYDYISQTSLGEMTGEILIEELLAMVAEHPAPEKSE
jgi:hypothetical protein